MQYPLLSEYIEAIRSAEDNFATLTNLAPVLDDSGDPIMSSGNFAVVFKMKDKLTGKLYAVKCFLKEQEGREDDYTLISEELSKVNSSYFISAKYLRNELFVDTAQSEKSDFPVLLMDWVEGQTLSSFLASLYNRIRISDEFWTEEERYVALYELRCLPINFLRMASWLIKQPFAHGDLKPDNIIIKSDGTFVLVDYDGMFVTPMQGMFKTYMGTPNFRHPYAKNMNLSKDIDNYAISVIALSLYAIVLKPELIDLNSDNCIITEKEVFNLHTHWMFREEVLMNNIYFRELLSLYLHVLSWNTLNSSNFDECIKEIINPTDYDLFLTEVSREEFNLFWEDDYGVRYSLDGKKVLGASKDLKDIEYTVREGVLTICDSSFQGKGLKSIKLPDSVIAIGALAFANNDYMDYCNIPSSVKFIDENNPWGGCFNIKKMDCSSPSFQIKDGILYSSDFKVLYGMIYWNANVFVDFRTKIICSNAFWSSRKPYYNFINHITLVNVKEIGAGAFKDCKSALFNIKHPIKKLCHFSFDGCESLNTIDLSEVDLIPEDAFKNCKNLNDIHLSTKLSIIESNAFKGCISLSAIEIPKNVSVISDSAFSGCKLLEFINVVEDNGHFCSIEGVLYNKSITQLIKCPQGKNVKKITIPESVCEIIDNAFADCTTLETIICNNKILRFGKNVFKNCSSLNRCYIDLDERTDAQSAWNLGRYLFSLKNNDRMKENGISLIKKAAELDNANAQWFVACCYKYGWNGKINIEEYIHWLKRSAENKSYEAMTELSREFIFGRYLSKNHEKAYDLLSDLEKSGNLAAIFCGGKFYALLGFLYEIGSVVEKNAETALDYYFKGAKFHDAVAEYNLARCYEIGIGSGINLDKAKEYYTKAKEHNHSLAAKALQRVEKAIDDLPF